MKLLIDSNIALDFLLRRDFSLPDVDRLFLLGYLKEFELWMSTHQVNDLFYVLTGGGKPALADSAKHKLRLLRKSVRLSGLLEDGFDEAMDSAWDDLEDACVYQIACKLKADAIITRDKDHFSKSSIKTFTCETLFDYLRKERGLAYETIDLG